MNLSSSRPQRQPASSGSVPAPAHPSPAAAQNLPPAFPGRAPWGTAPKLRAWQAEALAKYRESAPREFLAVATPGAGKTTFALQIAAMLLGEGLVRRVTVVAPTEHLKSQWADSAARVGISLDPNFTNAQGMHGAGYQGVAVTYAQVGMNPRLHRARTEAERTLVILDEIHHAGDALTWGDGVREAFDPATRRLALTGTPFRSDSAQIPFVVYEEDGDGFLRSRADYTYGYSDALRDHVVRPVIFLSYSGRMHWRNRQGEEISAQLGGVETKDITAQAWRTALDPKGEWIPAVLRAADQRLTEVRRGVPDAGGLVIATDQASARAYARQLLELTGETATVVLSDDAGAGRKIEEFAQNGKRWMVAVRMVSEGVDVPRLAVGVYATSTSTPMFFAQAVGRFVRSRRRGETASVFLPSVPILMALAGQMEAERDHVLDKREDQGDAETGLDEQALAEANREEKASGQQLGFEFEALQSEASFDRVLFDGGEYGTGGIVGSEDEQDFLGIPGLLDPDQVSTLLREHQARQVARKGRGSRSAQGDTAEDSQVVDHRQLMALRKELSTLVSAWAKKSGVPHGQVHNTLRSRCGGPAVPQASAQQIKERIGVVRGWFVGRR
ncbi:DEAD/DEAH box helicase [Devriesea agamarum]|uniref:DEAD/DEAH box helicase n=1 Tax=Devriesea agamarum TaxID=472569 RepID=UPI00071C595A|nr:DEAD/DEAH box helicase [Devriesea agamarum]